MRVMSQLSIETYWNRIAPSLTAKEQLVLDALEDLGKGTCEQVANYIKVAPHTISGRFTGLEKKGLVRKSAKKVFNSNMNRVAVYIPTGSDEYNDGD